ncbi:hypothetical protein OQA88_9299 [Cercophora sp. LCS_1]
MEAAPVVFRKPTRTNSAAEFVERGAGMEVLMKGEETPQGVLELQARSEFVVEIDRFAPKGVVFDPTICYATSQKSVARFQQTLKKLAAVLSERGVDKELGIEIKQPGDVGFNFQYLLGITNKLQEGRNTPKTKTCKTFVRECYRKVEDRRGVIVGILEMVPNDMYGSVLSGGFTLIMAAVEKHAKQREEIQNWLAAIPETLDEVQRLYELHRKSQRLHECANEVLVSMFSVLERIVNKITESWRDRIGVSMVAERAEKIKGVFKSKSKSTALVQTTSATLQTSATQSMEPDEEGKNLTIEDALNDFKLQMARFQKEVDMCSQERMGRIEDDTTDIKRGTLTIAKEIKEMRESVAGMEKAGQDAIAWIENQVLPRIDRAQADARDELLLHLQNTFYRVIASNPLFNSKTGGLDYDELKRPEIEAPKPPPPSYRERNQGIASRWIDKLKFEAHPLVDIKDCLDRSELLRSEGKNIANYILNSDELVAWTRKDESRILTVEVWDPPTELNNPLSFASAALVTTLMSAQAFPVLSFFCQHRNNDSPAEDKSGPIALANSLNAQLLEFIADHRPNVDLEQLEEQPFFKRSRKEIKEAIALLEALLTSLPRGDQVFIVLDCFSCLSGRDKDGEKVIKKLCRIVKGEGDVNVRLLVTDPPANTKAREAADLSLYVPDSVIGSGVLNVAETTKKISKKVKAQRKGNDAEEGKRDDDA